MQEPSEQVTAPALQALLTGRALAGEWVLDPRRSSIRLKSKIIGLVPVTGVFRQVAGNGTVSADGGVSGAVTVAAASIDTKNARRDRHLRSADFFDTGNHPDLTVTVEAGPGRCPSMLRQRSMGTARSGSTPRCTSTGPTSA